MKFIYTLILALITTLSFAQWQTETTAAPRQLMAAASTDSLLFFAGGNEPGFMATNRVEIYNVETGSWTNEILSVPRTAPAGVAHGDKVFFAGGFVLGTGENFNTIDIYDIVDSSWEADTLSIPRSFISAVTVGDKILFAGGGKVDAFLADFQALDIVDIYDISTQSWSTASLSLPRIFMGATVVGDKAFFAGGATDNNTASNRVDIYDATNDSWSIDSLSAARIFLAATSVAGKAIFAGGNDVLSNSFNTIDIYDTTNNVWSTSELSQPRMGIAAASVCGKAYFMGGGSINWSTKFTSNSYNIVDVYDSSLDGWGEEFLTKKRASAAAASAGEVVMIAGGFDQPAVQLLNSAEYMVCETVAQKDISIPETSWKIFPNPIDGGILTVDFGDLNGLIKSLKIYDALDREILTKTELLYLESPISIDTNFLSEGIYFVQIIGKDGRVGVKKLVIQK